MGKPISGTLLRCCSRPFRPTSSPTAPPAWTCHGIAAQPAVAAVAAAAAAAYELSVSAREAATAAARGAASGREAPPRACVRMARGW
eukprot:363631-Chlamydomonas_euryale.AAC.2